jgi:sec-independent protein translocase protein TatB
MADLKKSFDEVKDVATGLSPANVMTSLQKDVSDALQIGDIDKPAVTEPNDAQVASAIGEPVTPEPVTPTTPAAPTPETFVEAETHTAASEPLAITRDIQPVPQDTAPAAPDVLKDAKAS